MWRNLCKSLFFVRVQCRRKESSRSLSHLLMSFLYIHLTVTLYTLRFVKVLLKFYWLIDWLINAEITLYNISRGKCGAPLYKHVRLPVRVISLICKLPFIFSVNGKYHSAQPYLKFCTFGSFWLVHFRHKQQWRQEEEIHRGKCRRFSGRFSRTGQTENTSNWWHAV